MSRSLPDRASSYFADCFRDVPHVENSHAAPRLPIAAGAQTFPLTLRALLYILRPSKCAVARGLRRLISDLFPIHQQQSFCADSSRTSSAPV
jgi:hypothetical protein